MRILISLLLIATCCAQAKADNAESELLVKGCSEVAAIYDRQGQRHLYAGFTTSVSEALRAGYCKGVIDQYRRTEHCSNTWTEQAKRIAIQADDYLPSFNQLLSRSCG